MNTQAMIRTLSVLLFTGLLVGSGFASATDVAESIQSRGLLLTILTVYVGGLAVSLTPCIYPMIPITLSVIGARSAQSTPLNGFLRSLVFVLGIGIIYTALGLVVVSFSGFTVGFMLQSKIFLTILSLFFMVMGVSMLGYFDIQMPPAIAAKIQGSGGKGGFLGAFLLGITTGIVASPCGSPVLVGVLTYASTQESTVLGAGLLFSYAIGIGTLFLLLGTFPAFLNKVPKSGMWMEDVKKFLGIILIGVGFYYLQTVLPNAVYVPLVILACLAAGAVIAIGANKREKWPNLQRMWRLTGLVFIGLALYTGFTKVPPLFNGGSMIAKRSGSSTSGSAAITSGTVESATTTGTLNASGVPAEWIGEEEGLKLAKELGVPYVIDMGAEWCAACQELEKKTFPHPDVVEALAGFVKIHIDCTDDSTAMEKYGAISLPNVLFFNKAGEPIKDITLLEYESPEKFVERVKKVQ